MTTPIDMLYELTAVEGLDNMKVRATFSDGYSCIYDMRPTIGSNPMFSFLEDPRAFARAFVAGNCLCWHTPLEAAWPLHVDVEAAVVREDGKPYDFSYDPGRFPEPAAPQRAAAFREGRFIYEI